MKKLFCKLNAKLPPGYLLYLFLLVSMYLLLTEKPASDYAFPLNSFFRNLLPIPAVLYYLAFRNDADVSGSDNTLSSMFILCGTVFSVSGIIGWCMNHYQTFLVTAQTLYEHLRFWLCLYLFAQLFRRLSMKRYAFRLFIHVGAVSIALIVLTFLDSRNHIWPRQIYRWGIGSIQLFFGHPSILGAIAVFLIAMLCLLHPYLRRDQGKWSVSCVINIILTYLMLGVALMTLRVRLFGFAAFFIVLHFYMVVLRKKLRLLPLLAGAAAALFFGGKRLYGFYFSPYAYTMARGQFAINSLDIAARNLPFGSGFGTFGSRLTQIHYSPLYYQYDMDLIPGLSPEHPNYICDTFFPVILAESGWLGFIAYLGMIFLLIFLLFRLQGRSAVTYVSASAFFTAFCLLAFELLESTGTLAFSENYSVLIALSFGLALSQVLTPDRASA